ncbi:hypothetical protein BGZ83_007598 [Gryganskiella cystojenkinii]|nr:hypothetical protein BGZ83_007598 [Gryganskiella cystojenkinii]
MFMLSWIRASDASANVSGNAAETPQNNNIDSVDQQQQEEQRDDWVFLPSDHNDLMSASVSNLDLLSSSMTLYHPSSSSSSRHTHPAAGRSRNTTTNSTSGSGNEPALQLLNHKSRRQLKQEQRRQQELDELEHRPRYDPMMAKLRDDAFKMRKLNKMGLRTGRILSSTTGGANSMKGQQRSASATAATGPTGAPLKSC